MAKPWRAYWVTYIIDDNYDMRADVILGYGLKCLTDPFVIIFNLVLSLILSVYDPLFVCNLIKDYYRERSTVTME